jgi:hypothetical protein
MERLFGLQLFAVLHLQLFILDLHRLPGRLRLDQQLLLLGLLMAGF